MSDTTLYRHSARLIKWSVFGFVAGLVLLVATFTSVLALGVLGFLIMLFCLLVIERNVRKIGKAGFESITSNVRGNSPLKGAFGTTGKRWRERWQRDDGP